MSVYEAFQEVDIRVGRIERVELNDAAKKPAYKMWIDFGELGVKTSSGQYVNQYTPQELTGRTVICAVNLGGRRIAGFMSEVLVMGVDVEQGATRLLTVDGDVPAGAKVF
ncbi:tRNA-binding protein [Achromobacter seleniivolatilans]|uniref:tRNA-binding protein n=1 Tax=Achromobacter seleniivolatilans TaxID=3047478 RepID=A0ABY9M601_9BURK|nr:tRNA-binding protein [Achromobacter sp. R39]WMD22140.1 tRNA-binding protein [Achromobacter sp. R39]